MPIDSEDLWLINADASDRAKLDKALDYIQTEMPFSGAPSVEGFAGKNAQIEINHEGRNEFTIHEGVSIVRWDPDTALVVRDNNGNVLGVNSPAAVLLHEINHALDDNLAQNATERNATWDNDAERYATQRTNDAMAEAGEAQRENHRGEFLRSPDPTEHTTSPDGSTLVWVEKDSWGLDNFGGEFDAGYLSAGCPNIGGGGQWPLWPEQEGTDQANPDSLIAAVQSEKVILVGMSSHHQLLDAVIYG